MFINFRISAFVHKFPSNLRSFHRFFCTVKLPNDLQEQHRHDHSIDLDQTKQIHAFSVKTHFTNAQRTQLDSAANVTFLVSSYIKNGFPEAALSIYKYARRSDSVVDCFTVPSVLKACGQISSLQPGKEIHVFSTKKGFIGDVFVVNALIFMYGECGHSLLARAMFDEMPNRDVVSWSTMIQCYSHNGLVREALELVKGMNLVDVKPNEVVLINMANLLADLGNVVMAKAMHAYVMRTRRSNSSNEVIGVTLKTALIHMHAKCGNLTLARRLFDGFDQKNIIAWNVIISGCIRCCKVKAGADLFNRMLEAGILPNEVTLLSLIIESGFVNALLLGKQIHAYILRHCLYISLAVATALIDMYGKCQTTKYAAALFDHIECKDVSTWMAMVLAYSRVALADQAFYCFILMRVEGLRPNEETMVSVLLACAGNFAFDIGKRIHAYITKHGGKDHVILKTALIDMYAKCGDIDGARMLFNEATCRDICMWNAMIGAYGRHGQAREALELFEKMEKRGVKPNDTTYIVVLHACGHAGLVTEGKRVFNELVSSCVFVPKVEHYGCMVDLLGRAGLLDEAVEVIKSMPIKPNTIIWGALFAASKLHKNSKLEELASQQIIDMEHQSSGYDVLLSNTFAAANRWSDVEEVRRRMISSRIKKEVGRSTI